MAKAELMSNNKFQPIEILVTLESQAEVDIFYAIFNYVPICELKMNELKSDWCEPIRKALKHVKTNIVFLNTLLKR